MIKMSYRSIVFLFAVLLIGGAFGKGRRIVGGDTTNIRTYPFLVSIRYTATNYIFCGGCIISTRHILTAAHCFLNEIGSFGHVRVYTGITRSEGTNGQVHQISMVHKHPWFTGEISESGIRQHDIAVVLLAEEIVLNDHQDIIELPYRDANIQDDGFFFGWGATSPRGDMYPSHVQKIYMRVFPDVICWDMYNFRMHGNQLCAFNRDGVGPCFGDAGGPLVIQGKVVGILSHHFTCAAGIPDLYTRVYPYNDFITQILLSAI